MFFWWNWVNYSCNFSQVGNCRTLHNIDVFCSLRVQKRKKFIILWNKYKFFCNCRQADVIRFGQSSRSLNFYRKWPIFLWKVDIKIKLKWLWGSSRTEKKFFLDYFLLFYTKMPYIRRHIYCIWSIQSYMTIWLDVTICGHMTTFGHMWNIYDHSWKVIYGYS